MKNKIFSLLVSLSPCLLVSLSPCLLYSQSVPDTSIFSITAPDTFRAVMVTTKGEITVEAYRSWSPAGVDRLY